MRTAKPADSLVLYAAQCLSRGGIRVGIHRLDADARLVGMASADGAAIPWTTVRQRLAELTPGPRRVFAGWRDQYGCAARLNRRTRAAHPAFKAADARLVIEVPATRVPGTEAAG